MSSININESADIGLGVENWGLEDIDKISSYVEFFDLQGSNLGKVLLPDMSVQSGLSAI